MTCCLYLYCCMLRCLKKENISVFVRFLFFGLKSMNVNNRLFIPCALSAHSLPLKKPSWEKYRQKPVIHLHTLYKTQVAAASLQFFLLELSSTFQREMQFLLSGFFVDSSWKIWFLSSKNLSPKPAGFKKFSALKCYVNSFKKWTFRAEREFKFALLFNVYMYENKLNLCQPSQSELLNTLK